MHLGRIVKLFFTSVTSQGIAIVVQLVIPPFFLRFYTNGIEVYGEWIALSASITYLETLNYGIQTFANNQMTILYSGGEVAAAKALQSSAFRLLLLLLLVFVVGGLCVFLVPIASLLKLTRVSARAASLTLYLLVIQMAVNMMFSFLTNSYMAVGKLHRGGHWWNVQRLFTVLLMAVALAFRSPFPVLAAVQLASLLIFLALVFFDVRRTAPVLMPSLRYADWHQVAAILKPSGHFGLISIAGFLTWQGPVLLIQLVLGPAAAGLFALVRVVFQMSRQILSIASSIIGQDITLLFGQRNWQQLRRLYELSERIVLFLVPVVSIGSLLVCPILFTIWLHKRSLYEPLLCILMAIISAVLGVKEHKTQFQSASNRHQELSFFILPGYAIMLLVSYFVMKRFGLPGFLVTWLMWEIIQTGFVLRLNEALFPPEFRISARPVFRLSVFMAAAFALAAIPAELQVDWSLVRVAGVALTATTLLGIAAYFVFGVDEVRALVVARIRARFAPGANLT
jgi:O-antigen/teichoic acid export membrane protein